MSVVTPQRLPVRALRRVLDGIRQGSIDNALHALEEPLDEALHLDYELALLRAKERHPSSGRMQVVTSVPSRSGL